MTYRIVVQEQGWKIAKDTPRIGIKDIGNRL